MYLRQPPTGAPSFTQRTITFQLKKKKKNIIKQWRDSISKRINAIQNTLVDDHHSFVPNMLLCSGGNRIHSQIVSVGLSVEVAYQLIYGSMV